MFRPLLAHHQGVHILRKTNVNASCHLQHSVRSYVILRIIDKGGYEH